MFPTIESRNILLTSQLIEHIPRLYTALPRSCLYFLSLGYRTFSEWGKRGIRVSCLKTCSTCWDEVWPGAPPLTLSAWCFLTLSMGSHISAYKFKQIKLGYNRNPITTNIFSWVGSAKQQHKQYLQRDPMGTVKTQRKTQTFPRMGWFLCSITCGKYAANICSIPTRVGSSLSACLTAADFSRLLDMESSDIWKHKNLN